LRGGGGGADDGQVVRPAIHQDAVVLVAEGGRAGRVRPDEIALDDRAGIRSSDLNANADVAGNDIARTGRDAPDGGVGRGQGDASAVGQDGRAGGVRADVVPENLGAGSGRPAHEDAA